MTRRRNNGNLIPRLGALGVSKHTKRTNLRGAKASRSIPASRNVLGL